MSNSILSAEKGREMRVLTMRALTIRAVVVAVAALLLTVLGVAAQSDGSTTVTTTTQVPVAIDMSDASAGATNLVTATMIVTKAVVMLDSEVISQSISTQIVLPEDAPFTLAQAAAPELEATVAMVAAPALPAEDLAQANRGANLRGGPGTNYPVVGGVRAGDALPIVGQNDDGSWYKLAEGQWIAAFLVDNAPTDLPIAAAPPVPTPAPQPTAAPSAASGPEQEIADATAAIARDPNDADAYFVRAVANYRQSNYQKALDDINKVIALAPDEAVAYYLRGLIYQGWGNCPQAVQDFSQAISRDSTQADVYEARALCYLDLENYIMALPDLVKLLELNPNHPQRSQIEDLIQQIRQSA